MLSNHTESSNPESHINKKVKMMESSKTHPLDELKAVSKETGFDLDTVEFARHMDSVDPLRMLRNEFHYPKMKTLNSGLF